MGLIHATLLLCMPNYILLDFSTKHSEQKPLSLMIPGCQRSPAELAKHFIKGASKYFLCTKHFSESMDEVQLCENSFVFNEELIGR